MSGRAGNLKLSRELIEKTCAAGAELGATQRGAASAVGVSQRAFETWLSDGRSVRDGDALEGRSDEYQWLCAQLVEGWEHAEGQFELNTLRRARMLQDQNNSGWRLEMDRLAHRFPDWNPRARPEESSRPPTVILIGREMLELGGGEKAPGRELPRGVLGIGERVE